MQESISMLKVREILRLRYENKLTVRQIGQSCNVGRQTVSNYLVLAKRSGINWAEDKGLSDSELEEKLYRSKRAELPKTENRPLPDFEYLHRERKKRGVTLLLLWAEYTQENPDGYRYEMFCLLYKKWKKTLNICMRQEHKAGEKLFVDYCDGLGIVNRDTGEIKETELFIAAWGASSYTYAEASMSQNKQDWLMSHVRAFEYFERAPQIVVPDNLKAGVIKACRYEPEINRSYLELAQHYGCAVIPARPYKAKDKAKAEAAVLLAQRWILACLRNRIFYSLKEMNEAIRELLEKLNSKKMQKLKISRKEQYENLDKPAAALLPEKRYEYADWKSCRVNIDYHVEIESHYYSVPYQLKQEQVFGRLTEGAVEIYYKNKRITSHVRSYVKWVPTTKKEHMPPEHQKYLDQTPSKMLKQAEKIGPNTVEVIKNIFESRKYIQQSYRSCLGIMRLKEYYGAERLENACKRAVVFRAYSYKNLKAILVGGLDKQADIFGQKTDISMPAHENIRGEEYYKGGISNH
jgi:transposase